MRHDRERKPELPLLMGKLPRPVVIRGVYDFNKLFSTLIVESSGRSHRLRRSCRSRARPGMLVLDSIGRKLSTACRQRGNTGEVAGGFSQRDPARGVQEAAWRQELRRHLPAHQELALGETSAPLQG
jgi:hypothetical protein